MKYLAIVVLALGPLFSAQANDLKSNNQRVKVSRVVQLHNLALRPRLQVNVAVEDLGGNIVGAPTQRVHINLYSKGELANTDASFELGNIFKFLSAVRIGPGKYEVSVKKFNEESNKIEDRVLEIDAVNAIDEIIGVQCDDFNCEDSANFATTIVVVERSVSVE